MHLLLSNIVTILMLFEDSLFVARHAVREIQFWNTNSTANTIFLKSGFYPLLLASLIFIQFGYNKLRTFVTGNNSYLLFIIIIFMNSLNNKKKKKPFRLNISCSYNSEY